MIGIEKLFAVAGQAVVVTGGASGIGLGYAEALAANGARVTLLDMDAGRIAAEVARLVAAGYDVRGASVDVTDRAALDRAIDDAAGAYGRLDTIFANAGINSGVGYLGGWVGAERPRITEGALENYDDARWDRIIDISLNAVFATLRAAARHMRPQRSGRMIVTTSAAAIRCEPAIGMAYMAAKAGAAHLVRNVALELAADGITVNAIAPGMFATNIGGGALRQAEVQAAVARGIPAHRVGTPADMYGLALFLASPASSYVTGQQIVIDGGFSLGQAD
ncbi:SDR family NAD(P)-dependent oxidoreductase [Sphingomonas sp. MMS24-J13]|uniref:SDR family NAD(P)-dependent oxidoreductase n=1 Tax=Sphingomonas sp. MMS24-J13 TaxID=3238686 RepID=UPI00384D0445